MFLGRHPHGRETTEHYAQYCLLSYAIVPYHIDILRFS
nr:MAG TPA: hypothetical protein [Bacteriophage sp.]